MSGILWGGRAVPHHFSSYNHTQMFWDAFRKHLHKRIHFAKRPPRPPFYLKSCNRFNLHQNCHEGGRDTSMVGKTKNYKFLLRVHVFYPVTKSIQQSVAKKIFATIVCTRKQLFESPLKQKVQQFNCHTWKLPYLLSSKDPTIAFITNSQRPTQHYRWVLVNLSQFNSKPCNVLPCVWCYVPCMCEEGYFG